MNSATETNNNTRILIADDHTLIREGLISLLQRMDESFEVVSASDGRSALDMIIQEKFDLAVLDLRLPGRSGLDVAREVRVRKIPIRLVLMTGQDAESLAAEAINTAGADAFIYKTADMSQIYKAIQAALAGKKYFPNPLPGSASQGNAGSSGQQTAVQINDLLSSRELQVLKLIAEGHTSNSAGEMLSISTHTIRKHRENIKRKMGLGTVAELSAYAVRNNLI
jgi:DNA-binding NarL/FixJ family response regulator